MSGIDKEKAELNLVKFVKGSPLLDILHKNQGKLHPQPEYSTKSVYVLKNPPMLPTLMMMLMITIMILIITIMIMIVTVVTIIITSVIVFGRIQIVR